MVCGVQARNSCWEDGIMDNGSGEQLRRDGPVVLSRARMLLAGRREDVSIINQVRNANHCVLQEGLASQWDAFSRS